MRRLAVVLTLCMASSTVLAQGQGMTAAEQRLAICTVGEVRLQQMLQDAQAKIAALEKKAAAPAESGGQTQ